MTFNKRLLLSYLIIAFVSLVSGVIVMYSYNLNWITTNKQNTRMLIENFQNTYDLQRSISVSYSDSVNQFIECFKPDRKTCDPEEAGKKLQSLEKERSSLVEEINKLNQETAQIMAKFP